ncbi:MAG: arginine--tRNA ligase [Pseudomonadota bacterium]|nr:arginine--tRNA ligase [Gammaproteobacteria bacterium]MBU1558379.1 arginine--tRNA ligase [Gammaproteobacteria bacterium]MBU1629107.1 arginine--tRNA ligase [Gammaproteobacteria bacterium]MBU1927086.1 arginine--tRNA ligase [Gammaproteobacteria bacterium]MBU2546472.1 arginine--tRNA ligase [Gammaproteobacteria bacterium]
MKQKLQQALRSSLDRLKKSKQLSFQLPEEIQIEYTRSPEFGDFASNIALVLAKQLQVKPHELAQWIIEALSAEEWLEKVEVAGPGFINFYLSSDTQNQVVADVLKETENYGRKDIGKGQRVHIEYVSANPTGPLHVGHGRSAAYGAAVSDILQATGFNVHREYYINDVGRQMDILAISVWLRYLDACGEEFDFPRNGYKGDYIREIAVELKSHYGDRFHRIAEEVFNGVPKDATSEDQEKQKEAHTDAIVVRAKELLGDDYKIVHQFGLNIILADIKEDLAEFGVHYQTWFSEKALSVDGAIDKGIEALRKKGFLYEKEDALWFQSTQFGDEKDRVLRRANGQLTYFASDIAYHWNKLQRGFEVIIDVLGADHHGYVPRVRAAMQALGLEPKAFYAPLVQFAILYRGEKRIQMSTRGGKFVTLRELRNEVGNDATRFFYLMRKSDQHMDFDLELAKSQSNDNPVYYIQYAYARICSVFRQLREKGTLFNQSIGLQSLSSLKESHEQALMNYLSRYPETLSLCALNLEPHHLANYLKELANLFHTYYNAHTFIVDDEALCQARLCLIKAVQQVIKNGFVLLGVSTPEKM